MRAPALTVLNLVRVARRRGLKPEQVFEGLPWNEDSLEQADRELEWKSAAVMLNRLEHLLDGHDVEALLHEHVQTHPLLRLLSAYAASVNGWLELCWGLLSTHEVRYAMTDEHHALKLTLDGSRGRCSLWRQLMRATAVYAPVHLGGQPLSVLREVVTEDSLEIVFAAPASRHIEARLAQNSLLSLDSICRSLTRLGEDLGPHVRDGHPHTPREEARDEVSLLSSDWSLTPAEARVTLLLSTGLVPRQLAQVLGCAVSTVRVHLRNVYAKTETAGQRELADRVSHWRLR